MSKETFKKVIKPLAALGAVSLTGLGIFASQSKTTHAERAPIATSTSTSEAPTTTSSPSTTVYVKSTPKTTTKSEVQPSQTSPEQLAKKSSVKLVKINKSTGERQTWCDAGIFAYEGKIIGMTAGHCEVNDEYTFEITDHEGKKLGMVEESANSNMNEPNDFTVLKVSGDFQDMPELKLAASAPKQGDVLIGYAAAQYNNYASQLLVGRFEGESTDGTEDTPVGVITLTQGKGGAAESGSPIFNSRGEWVGPIHGEVNDNPGPNNGESKQAEYSRRLEHPVGEGIMYSVVTRQAFDSAIAQIAA